MHLVQQSSNQFYFEMILCDIGQIIVRKYRNVCRVRHGNYSSRYTCDVNVVLLHCGCLSLIPFIEISIQNNSSSSDVLNIQASISISPKFESK